MTSDDFCTNPATCFVSALQIVDCSVQLSCWQQTFVTFEFPFYLVWYYYHSYIMLFVLFCWLASEYVIQLILLICVCLFVSWHCWTGGIAEWSTRTWKDNTCSNRSPACWLQRHRDECQVIILKLYDSLMSYYSLFFLLYLILQVLQYTISNMLALTVSRNICHFQMINFVFIVIFSSVAYIIMLMSTDHLYQCKLIICSLSTNPSHYMLSMSVELCS